MEIDKKASARILSISPGGSVVASLADENINFNAYRASNHPLIVPTGRAPIYAMLDVLFALLARNCDCAAMQDP